MACWNPDCNFANQKKQNPRRQKTEARYSTAHVKGEKNWRFALVILYSSNIPCLRLRFHGEETMSNSSLLGVMRTSCMKEMEIPQGREAWRLTKRSLATVLPNFHTIRYDLQVRICIDVFCSFSRQWRIRVFAPWMRVFHQTGVFAELGFRLLSFSLRGSSFSHPYNPRARIRVTRLWYPTSGL